LGGGDHEATDGVQTDHAHGGTFLAQDEATCWNFAMPHSAIRLAA
jgi:chemotaxis response regulator CheB